MGEAGLEAEIERVRASGILGDSGLLLRLFEFLVTRSLAHQTPKEIEIAVEVFGKDTGFAATGDSVVRVYIHRLRRKLDDLRLRGSVPNGVHLTIPKGEYRLVLTPDAALAQDGRASEHAGRAARFRLPPSRPLVAIVLGAVLALVNLLGWAWFGLKPDASAQTAAELKAQKTSVWNDFSAGGPLLIVVGDYYLFGESDDGMNISRLVREFTVNSREDLSNYLMDHPDQAGRYLDVGLSYVPISSSDSLHKLDPLLPRARDARVVMASQLSTNLLKSYDVLYIGLLSGLGPLRDSVFAASRFAIGDSYDEIIDTATDKHYAGQAESEVDAGAMYRDYAYISTFRGPSGNRITIIAGTRDSSAQDAADTVSQANRLAALLDSVGQASSFEALYEVQSKGHLNFQSRLVVAAPLDPRRIWSTDGNARTFPRG